MLWLVVQRLDMQASRLCDVHHEPTTAADNPRLHNRGHRLLVGFGLRLHFRENLGHVNQGSVRTITTHGNSRGIVDWPLGSGQVFLGPVPGRGADARHLVDFKSEMRAVCDFPGGPESFRIGAYPGQARLRSQWPQGYKNSMLDLGVALGYVPEFSIEQK